jgi:cytochrome c oxidase subunit IV
MSTRYLSPLGYIVIDGILVVLTVLTVALSFMPASGAAHLAIGMAIAVAKATLVVLFFMHAWGSPAPTKVVIVVSVFWLLAVLTALTLSDYVSRDMPPTPAPWPIGGR